MAALPNLLTIIRLLMAPLVASCILAGYPVYALALLLVAGATDCLDGWLARRYGWSTWLGAFLDPIADKTLMVTTFIALGIARTVPDWFVIVVVGRDALILVVAGVLLLVTGRRDFPPSHWGKLSTVVQITAGLLALASRLPGVGWLTTPSVIVVWLAAAATVWSGLDYAMRTWREFFRAEAD
jgi:cardiolipin synthase